MSWEEAEPRFYPLLVKGLLAAILLLFSVYVTYVTVRFALREIHGLSFHANT